jgi:hypothetical protein
MQRDARASQPLECTVGVDARLGEPVVGVDVCSFDLFVEVRHENKLD